MADTVTNADNDKDERTIQKVNDILDAMAECVAKRVHGADLSVERRNLVGIVENCLADLTWAKLLLWEGMGVCPLCSGMLRLTGWKPSQVHEDGWCHWECTSCRAQLFSSRAA